MMVPSMATFHHSVPVHRRAASTATSAIVLLYMPPNPKCNWVQSVTVGFRCNRDADHTKVSFHPAVSSGNKHLDFW